MPARKRTGFARYINYIHEIAEYWDAERSNWVLVDPDVPAEVQSAWIATHGGPTEPATYGTLDLYAGDGMPGVRQALLQDLDGLNNVELTSHDWWGGDLHNQPDAQLTVDDLAVLDRIAELTHNANTRFDELRQFYLELPHGQLVVAQLHGRTENAQSACGGGAGS